MREHKKGPKIDPNSFYGSHKKNDLRPRIIVERKRTESEVIVNYLTIITSLLTICAAIKYLLFS